jgi:hypothetical protein
MSSARVRMLSVWPLRSHAAITDGIGGLLIAWARGFSPFAPGIYKDGSPKRHARLVLRPEHHEWDLVEQHPQLLDAVLLPESYVAPYLSGHLLEGHDPRKLLDAARDAGCDLWRDPETAGLCSRTILQLPATKRLHETPLAREFQMPLDLSLLADPEARRHALELVLATQDGSEMLAGSYFDFDRRDSPAHRPASARGGARRPAQAPARIRRAVTPAPRPAHPDAPAPRPQRRRAPR